MISKCYSVFDNKALNYNPPFFAPNDAVAIRIVRDVVADMSTNLGRHPSDYVLYCVGSYDDSNGRFSSHGGPLVHVVDLIALVTPKE